MIYDIIQSDIKQAMISKNNEKRDCLRSIVSEIKNQSINAGKPLTEEICISVLKKSVKQHNDSIENFKKGNRPDLVEKEQNELQYIECYLPKMYSEDKIKEIIDNMMNDNGFDRTKKNMGVIMKAIGQRNDANSIDRKIASSYLNSILT